MIYCHLKIDFDSPAVLAALSHYYLVAFLILAFTAAFILITAYLWSKLRTPLTRKTWFYIHGAALFISVALTFAIAPHADKRLSFQLQVQKANKGEPWSVGWVARRYLTGHEGAPKNNEEPYFWFLIAADQYSQMSDGKLMEQAKSQLTQLQVKGVEARANAWVFRKALSAADHGDTWDTKWVGQQYLYGRNGTPQNYEEAYFWLLIAEKVNPRFDTKEDAEAAKVQLTQQQIKVVEERVATWVTERRK